MHTFVICYTCKSIKSPDLCTPRKLKHGNRSNRGYCKECNHIKYRVSKNKDIIAYRKKCASLARARRNELKSYNPKKAKAVTMIEDARVRAKTKGIACTISIEDIITVFGDSCPLLGVELNLRSVKRQHPYSPSLDRIDNTKGYTPNNIWIISLRANRMKNDSTLQELISFSRNALTHFSEARGY